MKRGLIICLIILIIILVSCKDEDVRDCGIIDEKTGSTEPALSCAKEVVSNCVPSKFIFIDEDPENKYPKLQFEILNKNEDGSCKIKASIKKLIPKSIECTIPADQLSDLNKGLEVYCMDPLYD
jgi:hypothetical protein